MQVVATGWVRSSRYAAHLTLARTADDLERAHAQGQVASLMGAEGGQSIGCSLDTLRHLADLGVGYLTLTTTRATRAGPMCATMPAMFTRSTCTR